MLGGCLHKTFSQRTFSTRVIASFTTRFLKLEDSEAENSVVKLNTYKKKPTKKSTNPKIDRTESKDNLAFILSDLSEPKPEPEVKKSKSVIFYPLHIELKSIDDEKFEFIIQNESSHTVLSMPREMVLNNSADESTLSILKKLDLDLEFYGFVFATISSLN